MNKLKLFEITFHKLSADKAFIAYYLKQFLVAQHKTQEDILQLLNCSLEDYYKLGLCKAPEFDKVYFEERIHKISTYANVYAPALTIILQPAYLNEDIVYSGDAGFLKSILANLNKKINQLTEVFSLPPWFTGSRLKFYQAALPLLFTAFLFLNYGGKGSQAAIDHFYTIENAHYKDSIQTIAMQDNTFVAKIIL